MSRSYKSHWDNKFQIWSKPPTEKEQEKASTAAGLVKQALKDSKKLDGRNFSVYATGSYRNNTNVRVDSDIDIAVVSHESFYHNLPTNGLSREDLGFKSAEYGFSDFRNDVHAALDTAFGQRAIRRMNKTFEVRATGTRLNADVTAFVDHRRYTGKKANGEWSYHKGIELRPDNDASLSVINWHDQHYNDGVAKNKRTGRRYKRVVRILKNLRGELSIDPAPSFLIESLVYNVPDANFNIEESGYFEDVKANLLYLIKALDTTEDTEMVEVSGMKWLFRSSQAWTQSEALGFVRAAARHIGVR
jgi:predicted nucleotidyltransferase